MYHELFRGRTADGTASNADQLRAGRFSIFDRICERFRLTPLALSMRPVESIAPMMKEVCSWTIDPATLPAFLKEYAAIKSIEP